MTKTLKNKQSNKNKTRKIRKMTGGINIKFFSKYINQDHLPFMYFYNLNKNEISETKNEEKIDEYEYDDDSLGEEY